MGRTLSGVLLTAVLLSPVALAGDPPGFACKNAQTTPAGTRVCIGRVEGYPNDVAIVVPPNYRPAEQADVVLYLHGNNYGHAGIRKYLSNFRLPQALASSGRNSLMVVPLSRGPRTADHEEVLGSSEGYRRFMGEVLAVAQAGGLAQSPTPGSITLAGHSGAYRTLSSIVAQGVHADRTRELYLLDALYDPKPEFESFASRPGNRMWAVGTPAGQTLGHQACLQQRLVDAGIGFHGCVPNQCACCSPAAQPDPSCAPPSTFTEDQWQANRVGFLQYNGDHNEAAARYLPRFLSGR